MKNILVGRIVDIKKNSVLVGTRYLPYFFHVKASDTYKIPVPGTILPGAGTGNFLSFTMPTLKKAFSWHFKVPVYFKENVRFKFFNVIMIKMLIF
jgi:hypothetical protein